MSLPSVARIGFVVALLPFLAIAQDDAPKRIPIDKLKQAILTQTPETRVEDVDHERLVVRRIDVVDQSGTIRMSLAAPTPEPILDGIQYRRVFDVSGLTVFDRHGSERGGLGVADLKDGGTAVVLAQDHANGDAVGWRVMPDGSVSFHLNQRATVVREPELGNRIVPGMDGASRVRLSVAADGTPVIALADRQDRPRLRLTVTEHGHGAIEFIDADGNVVDTIAPEAQPAASR